MKYQVRKYWSVDPKNFTVEEEHEDIEDALAALLAFQIIYPSTVFLLVNENGEVEDWE